MTRGWRWLVWGLLGVGLVCVVASGQVVVSVTAAGDDTDVAEPTDDGPPERADGDQADGHDDGATGFGSLTAVLSVATVLAPAFGRRPTPGREE